MKWSLNSMRVFLTGGTGLIGREIARRLRDRGDEPVVLTRDSDRHRRDPRSRGIAFVSGDPSKPGDWFSALDGCDAVINLVGHSLFAERWNPEVKRKIRESRVHSTERVVQAIEGSRQRPRVLVQGSAIGYYGATLDENLNEHSPPGSDFLAKICREWEGAALPATRLGLRLVTIRTGIVLAKSEGALAAMTPIYRWLPGGAAPLGNGGSLFKPANGRQWMSWIHLDDIVGLFLLGLDREDVSGPLNGTSPNPVRHIDFGRALAKVLHRPFLPFGPPDGLLGIVLGEMAQTVTKGQKVLPEKALAYHYAFRYPELMPALMSVFSKAEKSAATA